MGSIRHIFIAPARGEPMLELVEAEAIADVGLRGDRYEDAAHRESPDCQLTLIELESIEAFVESTGLPLAPQEPRRNLVTSGVRLNGLCGQRFRVGAVELEGLDLCEPCGLFGQRTYSEAVRFFVKRGGLRCRIVTGGVLRVGDSIGDAS
ncbi:MOSC domain-containing protein [Solimonas sp. K1W22B-7]|uniref:MOSC domain-containing protein n=1 Tax=Solimonas sp. K1W22B-7 TaxID=2303331 RepID=UPI000E3357F1|nr:MOSC domain-containing protein [Solimonas sp. K1W22B-7]AXQ27818.1 MOSC domain-containing protein [Solimonas sp. K1W22B-7]